MCMCVHVHVCAHGDLVMCQSSTIEAPPILRSRMSYNVSFAKPRVTPHAVESSQALPGVLSKARRQVLPAIRPRSVLLLSCFRGLRCIHRCIHTSLIESRPRCVLAGICLAGGSKVAFYGNIGRHPSPLWMCWELSASPKKLRICWELSVSPGW